MSLSKNEREELVTDILAALAFTQQVPTPQSSHVPSIRIESRPSKKDASKMVDWIVTAAGQVPAFLLQDHINAFILQQKKDYLEKMRQQG